MSVIKMEGLVYVRAWEERDKKDEQEENTHAAINKYLIWYLICQQII